MWAKRITYVLSNALRILLVVVHFVGLTCDKITHSGALSPGSLTKIVILLLN